MSVQRRSAKSVTRRAVRAARTARDPALAARDASALAGHADALLRLAAGAPVPAGSSAVRSPPLSVAAYVSLPGEPGTEELRAALRSRGARVLLPVLLPDLGLDWVVDEGGVLPDPLRPAGSRLGADALAGCALVLVPALAVDRAGTRLGQGGGSYDRALGALPARDGRPGAPRSEGPAGPRRSRPLVLAVVHDDELLEEALPREPHDVPVDGVLAPAGPVLLPRR